MPYPNALAGLFGLSDNTAQPDTSGGLFGAAKRQVTGLLSDPVGNAKQTLGLLGQQISRQNALMDAAFSDRTNPLQITNRNALAEAANNMLTGPLGFAPVGMIAYRAGPPRGITADAGGPTFYSTKPEGSEPFKRWGDVKEYDIQPQAVFDTSKGPHRTIYEQFMKETGNPAGYGTTMRPMWMAEYELRNWLKAKGHQFDAIMFDEPTRIPSIAMYDALSKR